ncbi:hypothetical protein [Chitinophaga sp. MM2321]|uniref:hypothetical protein n=1 Tax=Chitinophaga sp. MM2321 TaxID=3137178 RepID=UPI0032D58823
MKRLIKFPLMLIVAGCLLLSAAQQNAAAKSNEQLLVTDTTCLVKSEVAYDFPDNMHKQVNDLIEDKMAGGIEEKGKITWENSPDAPEYYQIVLRKTNVSVKYKGTVCEDKLIWENVESCKADLKKLLNQ